MGKVRFSVVRFWPAVIIILFALFLLGGTLFPPRGKMIYGGDVYDAYFYWKNYLGVSIRSVMMPFWNPYNFSGTPFLSHPNINVFYPANWLFILVPLSSAFAVYFLMHLIIAGMGMYFLAREYTDKWGATAAAVTFAFSGYFAARIYSGHLEYIDTAAWIPLAFVLTRRAILIPKIKNIILAGIGLGLVLLSGNELFLLFTLEIIGLYILFIWFLKKGKDKLAGYLITAAEVGVLGLGLTALEVLPRLQFIRLSLRSLGVSYGIASSGSYAPSLFRLILQPFFYGKPDSYIGPWPNLSEYTYYVGIVPIILILLFIIYYIFAFIAKIFGSLVLPVKQILLRSHKNFFRIQKSLRLVVLKNFYFSQQNPTTLINNEIWFFLLVVIPIFLLISLGNNIPVNVQEFLWKFTPFYKSLRFPVRHLYVVVLAISVCTGMIVGSIKHKLIKAFLIIIMVVNLFWVDKQFIKLKDLPYATFDPQLISTLENDKSLYRLLPDYSVVSPVRRDLDFGAATMYKIQTTSDYNSMLLWRYYHFIDLLNKSPVPSVDYYNVEIPPPNPWSPIVNFLNIKYILSDSGADAVGKEKPGKFKLVIDGGRYRLYQNLEMSPRFFLVGRATIYPTEDKLENSFLYGNPDLEKNILFAQRDLPGENKFNLDCTSDILKPVKVVSYAANKIILRTDAVCNAFLSTSEVDYPGWKAKIDGRETPVYRSNEAFRALFVPKGAHEVVFYYSPDIYYIGGVISVITIICIIFLLRSPRQGGAHREK